MSAKQNSPLLKQVRETRATAHYQLGNLDAALVDLDFLVGQASSLPSSVLQYRTLTLARLGKSDEAKESLAKYLATNPPVSFQAYVRIQVPAWLGESAQASTELESSVTALGASIDDLYNVACGPPFPGIAGNDGTTCKIRDCAEFRLEVGIKTFGGRSYRIGSRTAQTTAVSGLASRRDCHRSKRHWNVLCPFSPRGGRRWPKAG